MEKVKQITPHLSNVTAPDFLAEQAIWLMWRFENKPGEAKPRKVPYYINGKRRSGIQGRGHDREQLATFNAARSAAVKRGFDGIGHACLDGNFTVIDFDNCIKQGELVKEIDDLALETYAEYSPSGNGIHLYYQGDLYGANRKSITHEGYGVELFINKGFVTFTGNVLESSELTGCDVKVSKASPSINKLINARFGERTDFEDDESAPPLGVADALIKESLEVLDADMPYSDWLAVGMALHHETSGEGIHWWDQWSAAGSKYPGEEVLQKHWESFGRSEDKPITFKTLAHMANQNGARISLNAISYEQFEDLSSESDKSSLQAEQPKSRFPVQPAFSFAGVTSWEYLIKGVIPQASVGVLFGESGAGKSFVMLDMALAVATGERWRDHRTTQGRVVYLIAEGARGFRNRLSAWQISTGTSLEGVALDVIDATPNFLVKEDALAVCKSILQSGPKPSLIIVDTLAQVLAGANENASEDIGKALTHCNGIHKATGAMVMLVHHSGKDSTKGARGWSGLRAAVDTELEVLRMPSGRMLRTTKQKDGDDFNEWGFDLDVVNLGEDPDGDVITSCVIKEAELPQESKLPRGLGKNEQLVLNVITDLALVQTRGIEIDALIEDVVARMPEPEEGKRDTRKQLAKKAFNKLLNEGIGGFGLEDDNTISILE